jgi:hypothetical protein
MPLWSDLSERPHEMSFLRGFAVLAAMCGTVGSALLMAHPDASAEVVSPVAMGLIFSATVSLGVAVVAHDRASVYRILRDANFRSLVFRLLIMAFFCSIGESAARKCAASLRAAMCCTFWANLPPHAQSTILRLACILKFRCRDTSLARALLPSLRTVLMIRLCRLALWTLSLKLHSQAGGWS